MAPERSVLGLVAVVAAVVVCAYAVIDPMLQELDIRGAADMAIEGSSLAAGTVAALWFVVLAPLRRGNGR